MGGDVPKQFLSLDGIPVVLRTLANFKNVVPKAEFILVLSSKDEKYWQDISKDTPFSDITIAYGGQTRTESVISGLKHVEGDALVAIHDAVRPFPSSKCILETLKAAEKNGAAIPVIPVTESVRKKEGQSSVALNRDNYCIVQTPQCFRAGILKDAYEHLNESLSDDASVVEAAAYPIILTEGNGENIKITTQKDLWIAESILKMQKDSK